jgi:prephenate dehydrogenase
MKTGIIGTGLIGGSLALSLRKAGFASDIIAAYFNDEETRIVLDRKIADRVLSFEEVCVQSDIIILAVPVNTIAILLPKIMDHISDKTIVIDVGSTKKTICDSLKEHPRRKQFVAAHPIAGTENNGPSAAIGNLFHEKLNIICESEASDPEAVELTKSLFSAVGMHTIEMSAADHDRHLAYVSHLSHISSFMLGLTVLGIEKNEQNIFNLAGSGFESTVRLAKSSPQMWAPILIQNKQNIVKALNSYIENLQLMSNFIQNEQTDETIALLEQANAVRKVLNKNKETKQKHL